MHFKIFGPELFGLELFKPTLFVQFLIYIVLCVLALHIGLLLVIKSVEDIKNKKFMNIIYLALYAGMLFVSYRYLVAFSWFNKFIFYAILVLYGFVVASRGFVNWYNRSQEISKKLDRIIELLEKKMI